jgi:hypothetical protein
MRPEQARILSERDIKPVVGPKFFREGEQVLFQFTIDTANIIGPRPATRKDQEAHAGAWAEFIQAEGVSALDRDASGQDGGSLPVEPNIADAVAASFQAITDKPTEPTLSPQAQGGVKPRRGRPPKVR